MLLVLSVAPLPAVGLSKGERSAVCGLRPGSPVATARESQSLLRTRERYAIDFAADSNRNALRTGNGAVPRLC